MSFIESKYSVDYIELFQIFYDKNFDSRTKSYSSTKKFCILLKQLRKWQRSLKKVFFCASLYDLNGKSSFSGMNVNQILQILSPTALNLATPLSVLIFWCSWVIFWLISTLIIQEIASKLLNHVWTLLFKNWFWLFT